MYQLPSLLLFSSLIRTGISAESGSTGSADSKCTDSAFKAILASVADASLNYVSRVPGNGSFGDASPNIPFPPNATLLPELCAASINVKTPQNTSYNFGLFLPTEWNSRIMTTGNSGLGGGVNWLDMGTFSHYGFATISTDTGHLSAPDDGSWGLNQPEKLINWGYRAMHGSVTAAKTIISAYYSGDIKFSYYASCSTGGRQGLKELQLHPETFNGVVVGAPAWWLTHLQTWTLKQGLSNLSNNCSSYIPAPLFSTIADEMLRQCDAQDGLRDQIIGDPFGCNFTFNRLLCQPSNNSTACLTAGQMKTAEKLYKPVLSANQTLLFPGLSLGSDAAALALKPSGLGVDLYRYWVFNDSNWDVTKFKIQDVALADHINPGNAVADNFDLSPFKQRGGKLIHYHGLADPLIPAGSSQHFFEQVQRTMALNGTQLGDFYRFFHVPGMSHCMGSTVAPWYIGGGTQFVPGVTHSIPESMDRQHDVIMAIMAWVEKGEAPDQIIATKFRNDTGPAGIESQRPICPYPQKAHFDGQGDPKSPCSWKCAS